MQYNIQSLLYRKDELNAFNLLAEIKYLINVLPAWMEKKECWIVAHPSEKMVAFDADGCTNEVLIYVQCLIDNNKPIYLVFADEREDGSDITILYKNTPAISDDRYILSVTMKSLSSNKMYNDFIRVLEEMVKYNGWDFKYIRVETEQYSFNGREVFDDRLSVGWVLYLPTKVMNGQVPSAYYLHVIEKSVGTIIVSKENFNGEDPIDVSYANNVEMELAANGLLPLIRSI